MAKKKNLSKFTKNKHKYSIKSNEKKKGCRILIVCEGEKTEPNYFESFKELNSNLFLENLNLEIEGIGANTITVVDKAIELKINARIPYDAVWAVFDKDSFEKNKFNSAIKKATDNGIEVAWSNEAFELWYLYHFNRLVNAMNRTGYEGKIEEVINSSKSWSSKSKYKYKKNDKDMYNILNTHGNQANAIKYAKSVHESYNDKKYADQNPCTTVYMLVNQLNGNDTELVAKTMKEIEELGQ